MANPVVPQIPVPAPQVINWVQPSGADLTAAQDYMGGTSSGQTNFLNAAGERLTNLQVMRTIRELFVEHANNQAADPMVGIPWASPGSIQAARNILRRLDVPERPFDIEANAHGFEPRTVTLIRGRAANCKISYEAALRELQRRRQAAIANANAQNVVVNVQQIAFQQGIAAGVAQAQADAVVNPAHNQAWTYNQVCHWIQNQADRDDLPHIAMALLSRGKFSYVLHEK